MNLRTIYCVLFQLLFVNVIKCYSFSEFWNDACSLIRIHNSNKVTSLACVIGSIIQKEDIEGKKLYQIPALECESHWVNENQVTEVCSSPPYQLYFDARGYEVLGCYNTGKPGVSTGSEPFVQCCQLRHQHNGIMVKNFHGQADFVQEQDLIVITKIQVNKNYLSLLMTVIVIKIQMVFYFTEQSE